MLKASPATRPQATILIIDPGQTKLITVNGRAQCSTSIVMHTAAEIDRRRRQLLGREIRARPRPQQGSGASLFMGPLLKPQQPIAQKPRFPEDWVAAKGSSG